MDECIDFLLRNFSRQPRTESATSTPPGATTKAEESSAPVTSAFAVDGAALPLSGAGSWRRAGPVAHQRQCIVLYCAITAAADIDGAPVTSRVDIDFVTGFSCIGRSCNCLDPGAGTHCDCRGNRTAPVVIMSWEEKQIHIDCSCDD